MAKLASLVVDVRTNTAKFNQGMDRVEKKMSNFSKTAKKLTGVLVTLGGAAVIGNLIKKNLEVADAIGKAADTVALSTDAYQELAQAAERAGIEQSQFTSNMTAFVKRVGEARANTGPLVSFLKKYDETLLRNIQNTKTQEEAFNLMANAIQRASTDTDKAALANAAFSRAGVQMVLLMKDGAAGADAMRQRVRELGNVIDEDLIRNAEQANDRIDEMSKVLSLKLTKAVADNADTIEDMAEAMIKLIDLIGKGAKQLNEFGSSVGELAAKNNNLLKVLTSFGPLRLFKGLLEDSNGLVTSIDLINEKIKRTKDEIEEQQDIINSDGFLGFGGSTSEEILNANIQLGILNKQLADQELIRARLAEQPDVTTLGQRDGEEESPRIAAAKKESETLLALNSEQLAKLTEQENDHWDRLRRIWQKNQTARQRFNQQTFRQQTRTIVGEMINLTQGVAQQDKRLFEINKVAATANAIINTIQGVTRTLGAYPYPINIGLAALSAAAGYAQVRAIQGTSFGGGGSAPSLSGQGGGSATVNTVDIDNQTSVTTQEPSQRKTLEIEITGIDEGQMFTEKQWRKIAVGIEDARKEMGENTEVIYRQ